LPRSFSFDDFESFIEVISHQVSTQILLEIIMGFIIAFLQNLLLLRGSRNIGRGRSRFLIPHNHGVYYEGSNAYMEKNVMGQV
jgi:hypothetical protein